MNILDENILSWQSERLSVMRVHHRQIGVGIGWKGMDDRDQIIPLLHSLRRPTFFTRDHDFYAPDLRHSGYCLVCLDVPPDEAAEYIRRFLRHKDFRTQSRRMGKVARARHGGISWWETGVKAERALSW